MSDLSKKKCVACDGNIPAFDKSEIHKYLKKIDGWDVEKDKNQNFFLIKVLFFQPPTSLVHFCAICLFPPF